MYNRKKLNPKKGTIFDDDNQLIKFIKLSKITRIQLDKKIYLPKVSTKVNKYPYQDKFKKLLNQKV